VNLTLKRHEAQEYTCGTTQDPTFRRYPPENNIFFAIVFEFLLKSLKLFSQLKLQEIEVKSFN